MKSLVVNFREQHVILVDTSVTSQYLSELSDIGRLVHAHADLHLPWLLRRIEDIHKKVHLPVILRHRH